MTNVSTESNINMAKVFEYIEVFSRRYRQELTPLEELMLLGIDPCEYYFDLFRKHSHEEEFPQGDECKIFDDEPEHYDEYDWMLLEMCPELKALTKMNGNKKIYEA